ncbi:hypothetical protein HK099_005206 [Clydaea vesicula]|uniref:Pyridoxamine 5'-phosphate oxidase Alr4036 family FMN-binding domain-containing protein n=1 Tax=Clydaea vesicula TaxID=447962 RepID=A0AAD5XZ32_9FUNG|nr:hypothetical protein HK099_005206 [Clydaea vesicula]
MVSRSSENEWINTLEAAVKKNYSSQDVIECILASVVQKEIPKLNKIVFQDFLNTDKNVLLFSATSKDSNLMGNIKNCKVSTICWEFPKTKQFFIFIGRIHIVSCPSFNHRFGAAPRKINIEGDNADEFWDDQREKIWNKLNPKYRATFTWPVPGEPRQPIEGKVWNSNESTIKIGSVDLGLDVGFKYMKLDAMNEKKNVIITGDKNLTKEEELFCVHNAAK